MIELALAHKTDKAWIRGSVKDESSIVADIVNSRFSTIGAKSGEAQQNNVGPVFEGLAWLSHISAAVWVPLC